MIDIRTKYSEEIARIVEANEANVKEAAESTEKSLAFLKEQQDHLNDLSQEAASALLKFADAAKKLKKLGRMKNPAPEAVLAAAQPFSEYESIAKQIPDARRDVHSAMDSFNTAQEAEADAVAIKEALEVFM